MNKITVYRRLNIILIVLLAAIGLCFAFQCYRVFVFDKKPVSINSSMASSNISVDAPNANEADQSWDTVVQMSDDPEDVKEYTGATCNITVTNHQDHAIKDWSLKLDIQNNCLLNGFWCGKYEIHQFRGKDEIIETVDSNDFDLSSMMLEHNEYSNVLMIQLKKGDYIVYLPSKEAGETVIPAGGSVNIGTIFYYTDGVDLSKNIITYYNYRKVTDGILFKVIVVMGLIWLFLAAMYSVSAITYNSTKKDVDRLTQSVINGLSAEYKSLWLINVKKRTIQLVRNIDEKDVDSSGDATKVDKEFTNYDYTMKYYINHFVDDNDRERIIREVELDSLVKRVAKEKVYSVYYVHHSLENVSTYYQMVFTKTVIDDTEYIILAYRDADNFVKEEQTKKKQLEDALLEAKNANQAKSVFLANMSHEIRTPINAVLGMDTMILRETQEDEIREYAKDIKNAGNTLLGIINDILDFSKIESGKMEIVPTKYQLDSAVNDLINMTRPKVEDKGLDFEINVNPEIPAKLFGDEIRIKQIIMNLLSNAAKYTKEGRVTFTVDYSRSGKDTCDLKVSVKDTGIGIKPEDMEKLFSPYERLDLKKNRTVEGTGLGLSIARNLLEKMGSRLEVQSVYGEGSEFSFTLSQPIWGEGQIGNNFAQTHGDEELPEKFHAPEASILVVDDVEMNLIVIKNMLKRIEVTPVTCLSGREALSLARESKFDLIFLDAMMPELSGEETLKLIRDEAALNAETPIVVLTANAIVGAKDEYIAAGFSDYLSKPVDGEQLEDMIQKYLPDEKIVLPGPEGFAINEEETEEDPKLKMIGEIPDISLEDGIKASGGTDTYMSICRNFYDTADTRIKMIRDYYDAKDADNYAIQTHALKSSARLIGALQLSEIAFEMEMAGKSASWEQIDATTEKLLDMYQSVYKALGDVFENGSDAKEGEPKPEISEKELKSLLGDFEELIEAYDFDTAKELFGSLSEYKLPDSFKKAYGSLKGYMAEVDYDNIIKEVKAYLN